VPFLVRSKGAEIGVRTEPVKGFSSTLSAFVLDFDSEIVFVGDAGTTEASRPSRRIGAEFTLLYKVLPWLTVDIDAAYTHARFTEDDPLAPGRYIPGATEGVVSAGVYSENVLGGWFGGAKIRYFGPRPLIEDNSVRSEATMPVSARLGYRFENGLSIRVDGFNLLDEKGHQIDYFYASRLPGEAGDVNDVHFHPMEPRSFRLVVNKQF
jgi:outer membrane receptor protein involved in Fe transport